MSHLSNTARMSSSSAHSASEGRIPSGSAIEHGYRVLGELARGGVLEQSYATLAGFEESQPLQELHEVLELTS